jgi:general secretion pathway protein I
MNRPRGFSLVEVLVAVAIVSIALAAGTRAANALIDNAQRLADVTAAQWCADNRLTALKLEKQFPDIGTSDYSCSQLGREYRGQLHVQPTPNPNFRRVDAGVATADGVPLLTFSTVLPRY